MDGKWLKEKVVNFSRTPQAACGMADYGLSKETVRSPGRMTFNGGDQL